MLERSLAARYASAVFFEQYNDFDVYIEDTADGYPKIFSNILSRSMSRNIALERVFPLGDRDQVIEAAKLELAANPERRSVYIIDGDLYLLCGEFDKLPSNVISLPRYCIENFLIDEETILSIMDEEHCQLGIEELKRQLNYTDWIEKSRAALTEMFKIFAVSHKLRSGIQTVSRGHKSICANALGDIDQRKADAICEEILGALNEAFDSSAINSAAQEVNSNQNNNSCFLLNYVSAKDYTLPLLTTRIRSITNSKASNINIKIRLSKSCDTSPMREVVIKISEILNRPDILSA